jgi:hypothetical protein
MFLCLFYGRQKKKFKSKQKLCVIAEDSECVTVAGTAQSGKVFLGCDTVFLGKWFGVFLKH